MKSHRIFSAFPAHSREMRVNICFRKHCWRDSRASPTLNYQPVWAESGKRHYRAASGTGRNGRSLHRAADAGRSHRLHSARPPTSGSRITQPAPVPHLHLGRVVPALRLLVILQRTSWTGRTEKRLTSIATGD